MTDVITPLLEIVKEVAGVEFNVSLAGVGFFATLGGLATLGIVYTFVWEPYVGKWLSGIWTKIKTL